MRLAQILSLTGLTRNLLQKMSARGQLPFKARRPEHGPGWREFTTFDCARLLLMRALKVSAGMSWTDAAVFVRDSGTSDADIAKAAIAIDDDYLACIDGNFTIGCVASLIWRRDIRTTIVAINLSSAAKAAGVPPPPKLDGDVPAILSSGERVLNRHSIEETVRRGIEDALTAYRRSGLN